MRVLEHGPNKGFKPVKYQLSVNLYVERTRNVNPHGYNYLSQPRVLGVAKVYLLYSELELEGGRRGKRRFC